jgi:hypothetical protein
MLPRFVFVFFGDERYIQRMGAACSVQDRRLQISQRHQADGSQKCPLIGMRLELVIDEQAESLFSRFLLERQRNQVAEAALGQRVLVGEQPVVRFEFQLPDSGASMADDGGTEAARIAGRYGGREEDPGMGASRGGSTE